MLLTLYKNMFIALFCINLQFIAGCWLLYACCVDTANKGSFFVNYLSKPESPISVNKVNKN